MAEAELSRSRSGLSELLSPIDFSNIAASLVVHSEIERKFLITAVPDGMSALKRESIEQFYIPVSTGTEVRLRRTSEGNFLTEKKGFGLVREETEAPIPERLFESLLPRATHSVKKTRYFFPLKNGASAEVNLYEGALSGLRVAEVEFSSEDEAFAFMPETWFQKEVTYDGRYSNLSLARDGRPAEVNMQNGIEIAKSRIETLLAESSGPVVVLVSGASGSGKTYFGEKLEAAFGGLATLINLDDYYYGPSYVEQQRRLGADITLDHPTALDLTLAARDLEKLLAGETITKKIYNYSDGPYKLETVASHRVIILEGLFALESSLEKYGDFKVFIDSNRHDRLIRKLLRDLKRGTWPASRTLGYVLEVGEPAYQRFVEPTKISADLIIDSVYNPDLEAKRAAVVDTPLKFRLSGDISNLNEMLRRLGAEELQRTEQTDIYYNTLLGDISGRGEIVRLRKEPNRLLWTYKGPLDKDQSLERRKLDIDAYPKIEESLSHMYRRVKCIEKTRSLYRFGPLVFSLDANVTSETDAGKRALGNFLEFRLSGSQKEDETLEIIIKELGVSCEKMVCSYFEM